MAADGMYSMQALRDSFEATEDHVSYLNSEFVQRTGRAVRARPEQAPPTVEDLEAYRRVMEAEADEDEPAPMPMPAPLPTLYVFAPTLRAANEVGRRVFDATNAHGQRVGAYEGPWYDRNNMRAQQLVDKGRVLYGVFDKVAEELAQKREAAVAKGEKVDGNINEGQYKEMLDAAMKLYHIKPRSPQTIIGEFTSLMGELADVENTSVVWNDKTERDVRDLVVELWRCNPVAAREEPAPVSTESLSDAMFIPTTSRDAEGNEWRQILTNRPAPRYERVAPAPVSTEPLSDRSYISVSRDPDGNELRHIVTNRPAPRYERVAPASRAVMENRGPAFSQEPPVSFDVTAAYREALNAIHHRAPQAYQTTPPRSERHAATVADVHAERLAEARQLLRDPPDVPLYTDHAIQTFDSRVQERVRQRLADVEQLRRSAAEDQQRMEAAARAED